MIIIKCIFFLTFVILVYIFLLIYEIDLFILKVYSFSLLFIFFNKKMMRRDVLNNVRYE